MRRLNNNAWRSGAGAAANGDADDAASLAGAGIEVPKRKSSLKRTPSLTKGFL
ncbi:hypothetical protein GGS23DRAFT_550236 [Durotheca rogersii]|uniref:uncharacterized protein n=1 Tax=Durotheca rogersii TaxID=419775 RepID=UPI00221F0770|nr:uncharacterized protein GGS23DRAFT_550236 [Durotheca rogersii]KAI5867834.1 hypothetical protein GGS23DRAFT_550236 [Durotheca rogersii]